MIAAVKGWPAGFAALLFFLPAPAFAAQDLSAAVRELAHKTASYAARGETVSVACRNLSSQRPTAMEEVRTTFVGALQDAGLRIGETGSAVEVHLTMSEDQSQYLLVEEAHKGDDRQIWIASWKRGPAANGTPSSLTLEKRRVWEQDEQILDVAFPEDSMLVLAASKLTLFERVAVAPGQSGTGQWEPRQSATLAPSKPWPRDLRGHLKITGANFQVFLPGMVCNGTLDSVASMQCRGVDEPWLLESGSRGILLANFSAARNYFDGRVVTQSGLRKTVAPFYSAVSVEDQGRTFWLLAMLDGRTQVVDAAFENVGTILGWGSDIAGVDARCGSVSQVMAARAGDTSEADAVQLFAVANRTAAPLAGPVAFSGPVTALWTSGASSVLAVQRDLKTGRYAAYILTVACSD